MKAYEKLESLVLALIEELRSLEKENRRLGDEVADLRKKLERQADDNEALREKAGAHPELEAICRKLKSDRAATRKKVRSILDELEQADWI